MTSCATGQCGLGDWDGPVPGDPSNNITLTATPAYGGIDITWTYPATNPHAIAYFKLFRGFTDQYQLATELPPVGGGYYFDKIRTVQTCYYWIQGISKNGTIAAAIGPAVATSKLTISETIEELTGKIDAGMLATALRADISQISLTKADLFKEIKDREDGQTSLAQSISDAQNGVAQAHTFILQEANSRIAQNAVLVERIEGVAASVGSGTGSVIAAMQVTINQHTTDLGTLTTTVNSLYTVKLTANGLIGGFGLSNNGSSVEAGFDVDKFWIGRTGADKRKPFIIDGGVVYIDDAAIRKLTFEKLRAADGSVIVENGKLKADYISGKGLEIYNPAGDKLIVDPSAAKPIDNSVINPAAGWLNSNVALTRGQTVTLNPECTNTTEWTGPGIDFVKSVTGIPNGTAIGNLSGIGGQTLISKTPAPFDSARRYRVSALCFSSSGTGACYLGVVWVDRNGADIIGTSPAGWAGGTYSYFGLVNQTPPTSAGYYSQEFGFGVTTCEVPANAVAMRLCFLPNYSNTGGARHYVTDFKIEDITDSAASSTLRLIGGDGVSVRGNTITRTKDGGAWDVDAYSASGYTDGAQVSFTVAQNNKWLMAGLNSNPTEDRSYESLDRVWYAQGGGGAGIYEDGNPVPGIYRPYNAGDAFAVVWDGVNAIYYHNGVRVRGAPYNPAGPVHFDCSLHTGSASITNIQFASTSSNKWGAVGGPGKPLDSAGLVVDLGNGIGAGQRNRDDPPSFYTTPGKYLQFKQSTSLGLPAGDAWCTLETNKQYYTNGDGGVTVQYAYSGSLTWRRNSSTSDVDSSTWTAWVQDLDRNAYTGHLDATKGAPSGTFVGGALAEVVRDGAANGSSAYNAIVDSAMGLNSRLLNGANNVLQYGSRIIAGNLSLSGSGAYQGGYGVAMTQGGIVGVRNGGFLTFSLDAGTGNAVFGGELSAAYGTLGSLTIANGGFVRAGQSSWANGTGFFMGLDGNGNPSFSVGNALSYLKWSSQTGLELKQDTFTVVGSNNGRYNFTGTGTRSMGQITAAVTGGIAPYSYVWNASISSSPVAPNSVTLSIAQGSDPSKITPSITSSIGANAPFSSYMAITVTVTDSTGRVAVGTGYPVALWNGGEQ